MPTLDGVRSLVIVDKVGDSLYPALRQLGLPTSKKYRAKFTFRNSSTKKELLPVFADAIDGRINERDMFNGDSVFRCGVVSDLMLERLAGGKQEEENGNRSWENVRMDFEVLDVAKKKMKKEMRRKKRAEGSRGCIILHK